MNVVLHDQNDQSGRIPRNGPREGRAASCTVVTREFDMKIEFRDACANGRTGVQATSRVHARRTNDNLLQSVTFPRQRIILDAKATPPRRVGYRMARFARTPIADSMDQPPEIRIRAHKIGPSALSAGFFVQRC
jgi:hypothetical protein